MVSVSIAVAFLLGFGARQIGLPPLVGFLIAGFLLRAAGFESTELIRQMADIGVIILLFTIGLKLKIWSFARPEIWAGASLHMLVTVIAFGLGCYGLALAGFSVFAGLGLQQALLIAFALSFSSTVFAVKVLEEKGELPSLHGRTAIGILIVQDLYAVLFLTLSAGALPSPWAFALVGLIALRPLLGYLLDRVGHGELLPLFSLFSALAVGVFTFELVGVKPGLGALIIGMLMAGHRRAADVANSLFSFKEVFLVGFFLNIGLSETPTLQGVAIAVLLVLLIPLKSALFFFLLTRFHLRARSSLLATLSLSNYSEFGLIVGAVGVSGGWLADEWLVILAIALSISFLAAAPLNRAAHSLYARWHKTLRPFETAVRHPDEHPIHPGDRNVIIFGMGRIGTAAYDQIRKRHGDVVIGIDSSAEQVAEHQRAGRAVMQGDATDSDFWERAKAGRERFRLVMLAMPDHLANLYALEQMTKGGYPGFIAAIAHHPDQVERLRRAGADMAFNTYAEAGTGFAGSIDKKIQELAQPSVRGS